jgi:parallel beta-helix repeat protein
VRCRKGTVKDDGVIRRTRSFTIGSLAAAALWLPLPSAPAATQPSVHCNRTLSPNGSVTIERAVHARKRPRVLCLRGGVYRTGTVNLRRRGMTITSVPGQRAIWRGRIVVRARNVTLERLTLDGSTGRGMSLPSPTINGANFTLRDSDVTNRNGICVTPTDYKRLIPTSFLIERNRIHDCGRRPRTNHDHGIYVSAGTGLIRSNVIYDNADRGIQLYPAARGVQVSGNTLEGNGEGIIFGAIAARNVVTGNLITNSQARWNVEYTGLSGRGNQLTTNCLQARDHAYYRTRGGMQPGLGRYVRIQGNVKTAVRYADPARGDYRPASVSAFCQGMGAPADVAAGPAR